MWEKGKYEEGVQKSIKNNNKTFSQSIKNSIEHEFSPLLSFVKKTWLGAYMVF